MSPRIFWFLLGGASAAWWMKKHDEHERRLTDGRTGGEEPSPPHCMKHSWYWKHRHRWGEPPVAAPAGGDANTYAPNADAAERLESTVAGFNGSEASEKLVGAVRTGIRSVLDTMVDIEKAFKEERAEMYRHRQEQGAAPPEVPHPVPYMDPAVTTTGANQNLPREAPKRGIPDPAPTPTERTLSQILVALEKLNAKLDQPRPGNTSGDPPRLV